MADSAPQTHWIQRAIKRPGALKRKAQAAGMSTGEFARAHQDDGGRTGRQARLATTLRTIAHGGKG